MSDSAHRDPLAHPQEDAHTPSNFAPLLWSRIGRSASSLAVEWPKDGSLKSDLLVGYPDAFLDLRFQHSHNFGLRRELCDSLPLEGRNAERENVPKQHRHDLHEAWTRTTYSSMNYTPAS